MGATRKLVTNGATIVLSAVTIGLTGLGVSALHMDNQEVMTEMVQRSVKGAGWNEVPEVHAFQGPEDPPAEVYWFTSFLSVGNQCYVDLLFQSDGDWQLYSIKVGNTSLYNMHSLLEEKGISISQIEALEALPSPTRRDITAGLRKLGICN